eukprot:gene51156-62557_t
MAAGKGTRMKSRLPKVLHRLAGRALLQHVVDTAAGLNARRVVVITGHGAAEVEAGTHAALAAYADLGAEVEEVTEEIDWIEFEGRVLYQANFTVLLAAQLPRFQNVMDPVTLEFMRRGEGFTLAQFREAQFARTRLFRQIQALLERYDVLMMPTMSRTALPAEFDAANEEVEVDGVKCGITRQGWTSPQYPFNLTGHPALTVPSGFGADGLPFGLQIVGRWR